MKLKKLSALGIGLIAAGAPMTTHAKAMDSKGITITANAEMKQGEEVIYKPFQPTSTHEIHSDTFHFAGNLACQPVFCKRANSHKGGFEVANGKHPGT